MGITPMTVGTDVSFMVAAMLDDIEALETELKAYREGGVTEEILRRNDGYIKVGKGCVIMAASSMPNEKS